MKKTIIYILLALSFIASLGVLIYTIIAGKSLTNIISSVLFLVFSCLFIMIGFKITKNKVTLFIPAASILLTLIVIFNLLSSMGVILPQAKTVNNFINTNIASALKWAKNNDIEVTQTYEYSDVYKEFQIMSQSVKEGTLVNKISEISFIISSGPDYEKTVIIPNMLGWKIDAVSKFVLDNHLINVTVNFEYSSEVKDIVIKQDKNGELKRNTPINITFSLGGEGTLEPVKLIDLTNKSLFDATLWLGRNGIKYTLDYAFSDTVKRNFVTKQSLEIDKLVNPMTDIGLVITISKGKQITVPDLLTMKMDAITKWITDNNLKISFSDSYDDTKGIGEILEANYKKGDIIEEGTLITVTVSKGQLRMPDFKTLYEYRDWANKYGVDLEEVYEFNNTVSSGNIISLSYKVNDIIPNGTTVTIKVSQGKPIVIPTFTGKTKDQATSLCKSSGLACSYVYGSYSSTTPKDNVTSQSKKSGAQVIQGSSIVLTLSKGTAATYEFNYLESWLKPGDTSGTITSLRSMFTTRYPGVTFSFVTKAHNTLNNGLVHPDSPTNIGTSIEQGKTYTVWIVG